MMKFRRKESLKPKAVHKFDGNNQEKPKKKCKKRKSILFKPEKPTKVKKLSDNAEDCISEISLSFGDDKTIISNGRSDFDVDHNDEMNESDVDSIDNNEYSSSFLSDFLNDSSDGNCSSYENENLKFINNSSSEDNSSAMENTSNEFIKQPQYDDASDLDTNNTDCEIYECDSDYIVILKYSQNLRIFGYCELKVLHGNIDVLGHSLSSSSTKQSIYSPKGTSLLAIQNTTTYFNKICKITSLVSRLSNHPILKDLEVRKDCSILLFMKKHDYTLKFIEEHISQWILPKKTRNFPCIEINPKGSWNTLIIPMKWNEVIQTATGQSKILICGGKGVGKSTFLRYAVNRLLERYKCVKVIDLDPGQSEFNVPSTLSIVTVKKPLLGVNYTHLKSADRAILSDINISLDPNKYIECIQEIIKQDFQTENVPTIINTMGFINDLAFHLMASTVALLKPDRIVYITSSNKKKNFKIPINQKTLSDHAERFTPNLKLNFSTFIEKIPSATDENVGWSLQSRQMREMCILAYFGQSVSEECNTLQDYRLPMFEVDLMDISICDKNNVIVPVEDVNAKIVALCRLVNEDNVLFECFGWGIVRCYNPSTRRVILITPTNKDTLEEVTHLVVGCLTLPPSVYMNQNGVLGHIPYIFQSDLKGFNQMAKRSRIPFDFDKKL